MKKLSLIVLGGVLLGGCIPGLNKILPAKTQETKTEAPQQAAENQPFSGTVQAALALGVPMKCTYETDGQTGTAYIKGGNFYGEYTTDGVMGYSIVKGDCFWGWGGGQKQGATMCASDLPKASPGTEADDGDTSIWDNKDVEVPDSNMNCVPALVDDSMFTPPADVQFTDLGETMKQLQKTMEGVNLEELKKLAPQQ